MSYSKPRKINAGPGKGPTSGRRREMQQAVAQQQGGRGNLSRNPSKLANGNRTAGPGSRKLPQGQK